MLFVRERDAGHIGAADFGEIEPEPAPAATDVEHAQILTELVRFEQQLGRQMPFLRKLRVVERLAGLFEIGAAILPVGVEEERVEASVEIVMMRHIAARAGAD